ncbi:MAG: deoxyribose-phosphate aldolase [Acetomicrobium sp.]|uniref:deoxyribose-phosphate aldolase n=1 Tax=Acetomicrobium sp. TaxID=1872099 RepID=UPI002B25DF72|nr:deoxyribose-phosphate aldolase [Acetomicrobium sp.]HPT65412.1 deoxyribose-phosphate aldolase [Acetomicrobium sp.]HXK99506.1 deoxyribose-phosphate aldolase [Acetomicrobium sp.]
MTSKEIAQYIDHTNLRPMATKNHIELLCAEALQYRFAAVCVNPSRVQLAAMLLKGSGIKVASVVGFPLGATFPEVKALEAKNALKNGAEEIDMVINIGALKDGDDDLVLKDIEAVIAAASGATVKVILECCYLTEEEKIRACRLSSKARANFVKTSTGFGSGGATVEDIKLLRANVPADMGVKAAGGIRDFKTAHAFIKAGATRIGTSNGPEIISTCPA